MSRKRRQEKKEKERQRREAEADAFTIPETPPWLIEIEVTHGRP